EAFKNWESISGGKGVDFLFIDGDHSYEGVTFDLTSWGSIVKRGGVIIAHDYCNLPEGGLAGVDVAIHNTLLNGKFEVLKSCYASIAVRKK
ncbi:MAG: class I SAM-dependent methyltransferase, partial [Nitrospinota bacterium]|nr:class I SAM-dependent methyltransferase [Nitrospinota bacterium]